MEAAAAAGREWRCKRGGTQLFSRRDLYGHSAAALAVNGGGWAAPRSRAAAGGAPRTPRPQPPRVTALCCMLARRGALPAPLGRVMQWQRACRAPAPPYRFVIELLEARQRLGAASLSSAGHSAVWGSAPRLPTGIGRTGV